MADLETFCIDDIPKNSFLIIRVDVAGPMEKNLAAKGIIPELMKYKLMFREKNITLMIMTPKEGLEVLTEEEMNQAGWIKKK